MHNPPLRRKAPFTDYRYEKPGTVRKITAQGPARAVRNHFRVELGHDGRPPKGTPGRRPRRVSKSNCLPPASMNRARSSLRPTAMSSSPKATRVRSRFSAASPLTESRNRRQTFATGLNRPYGIAFYPPGPNPEYVYVGNTDAVVRFPYHNGDLKATGKPQHIADLPGGGGHWTRDIVFSPDGKQMFVGVGSDSNVDDPDTHPDEKNRADILVMNPDGSNLRVYAYGIRNAGGGLAINPRTGELWCSVNERDDLGDNLVPDYITHVQAGGFYGWPYYYIGGNQDPRLQGKHPELKDKVHRARRACCSLTTRHFRLTFYEGKQFPAEYQGDIFASQHGSWNKSVRVGYEVIRVPLHQIGKGERRVRGLPHRLRASQWTSLGTSGRGDGGSGWIVAGHGRWFEFDLAGELHGEIVES